MKAIKLHNPNTGETIVIKYDHTPTMQERAHAIKEFALKTGAAISQIEWALLRQ